MHVRSELILSAQSYVNEFVPQVQAAAAVGKDFAIGEFSSVSCSGKENVTDAYGQALWIADSKRV